MQQAIKNGHKVVEVDVVVAADGVIVCSHGDDVGDSRSFLASKIDHRFTAMALQECLAIAKESQLAVVVDVKHRDELPVVARWLNAQSEKPEITLQIANEEELRYLDGIPALYNLTFTQDYARVSAFCASNRVKVVSISARELNNSEQWKGLLKHNVKIFAHTVNSLSEYKTLRKVGVSGVFTDFLTKDALLGGDK